MFFDESKKGALIMRFSNGLKEIVFTQDGDKMKYEILFPESEKINEVIMTAIGEHTQAFQEFGDNPYRNNLKVKLSDGREIDIQKDWDTYTATIDGDKSYEILLGKDFGFPRHLYSPI